MAGTSMQRDGKMRNGFAENNSYGKSGTARFLDGGGKLSIAYTPGRGHYFLVVAGYEWRAPQATTAFMGTEEPASTPMISAMAAAVLAPPGVHLLTALPSSTMLLA